MLYLGGLWGPVGSFDTSLVLKYMGAGSQEGMCSYPIFVTVTAELVASLSSKPGDMRPAVLSMSTSAAALGDPFMSPGILTHKVTTANDLLAFVFGPFLHTSTSLDPVHRDNKSVGAR